MSNILACGPRPLFLSVRSRPELDQTEPAFVSVRRESGDARTKASVVSLYCSIKGALKSPARRRH